MRWLLNAVAGLTLLAVAAVDPARAQNDLPADPELDRVYSDLIIALSPSVLFGPVMAPELEARRLFMQSMLWNYRLQVDDALMTAWTTANLLQLDQQMHMATRAGDRLVGKLKDDLAWYEDQYSFLKNPAAKPGSAIEEEAAAKYAALKDLLGKVEGPLTQAAARVQDAFDQARKRVAAGGYVRAMLIRDGGALAQAMGEYAKVAADAEKQITEASSPGLPITVGGFSQTVPVAPLRQLRLTFANQSKDLVFFIRTWALQPDGSRVLREDTADWITLYPQDAATRLADTGPGGKPVESQLPSQLWLPAKPGDRLELRVATYGPERQKIRWQPIVGQDLRPELTSLMRGFYYFGVQVQRSQNDTLVSRLFPMNESYTWRFNGLWEAGMSWEKTDTGKLREAFPDQLALTQDHIVWDLPKIVDTILQEPLMEADVEGQASIRHVGPTSRQVKDETETGSGRLLVRATLW